MRRFTSILIITALLGFGLATISAADSVDTEVSAFDLTFSENLEQPAVPNKARQYVTTAMDQIRRQLLKNELLTHTIRNGEVVQVTLSCADLFAPGAIELKPKADDLLRHFSAILREPSKYKVVVAVYSDNTGDDMYADSITSARANAIDDYFWTLMGEAETNVIPYGMGKDNPVKPNDSMSGRAINRRVEIYIVPDWGLLQAAGVRRK